MFQNLGSFFTASLSEESQRDGDLEEAEEPVVDLEQGDFRFLPEQDEEQTTSSWGDAFPAGQDETERLPLQWGRQQEDQENFVPSGDGELDTELLLEQGLYHDDYDDEQLQYGFGFWEAGDEDDSSFIPHTSAERGTSAPVGNSTTTLFGGMLAHRHHEGEAAGVDEKDPAANLSAGADEDNSEALARALAEVNRSELDDAVLVLGAEVDADPGADGAAGGAAAAVAAGSMYGGYGMGMPMRGPSMKGMPFGSMGGRGSMALGRGSMLMGSKGGYGSMAGSKMMGSKGCGSMMGSKGGSMNMRSSMGMKGSKNYMGKSSKGGRFSGSRASMMGRYSRLPSNMRTNHYEHEGPCCFGWSVMTCLIAFFGTTLVLSVGLVSLWSFALRPAMICVPPGTTLTGNSCCDTPDASQNNGGEGGFFSSIGQVFSVLGDKAGNFLAPVFGSGVSSRHHTANSEAECRAVAKQNKRSYANYFPQAGVNQCQILEEGECEIKECLRVDPTWFKKLDSWTGTTSVTDAYAARRKMCNGARLLAINTQGQISFGVNTIDGKASSLDAINR